MQTRLVGIGPLSVSSPCDSVPLDSGHSEHGHNERGHNGSSQGGRELSNRSQVDASSIVVKLIGQAPSDKGEADVK